MISEELYQWRVRRAETYRQGETLTHEEIEEHVAEFLARGGEITKVEGRDDD